MAKTSKHSSVASAASKKLNYEEALEKLEALVEEMESGDLALEALLKRFEDGTQLVQLCQAKLGEAELRIQQLEENAQGNPELKPVDTATPPNA